MRPLLLLAVLAAPVDALACGAFFCASGVPMDQSAERIVFAIDEESHTVETHVQVSYQGEASRFAWVVPVPGVPDVGLSTDALFQVLSDATTPRFVLERRFVGCDFSSEDTGRYADNDGSGSSGSSNGPSGGGSVGIAIVASGQSGPYDWKVVAADSEASLRGWLADPDHDPGTDDAYDVPDGTTARLATYLADGSNFIAFRLTPEATRSDIVPIKLRWPGDHATIPLTLTGLAATPDLRLQVYVLGAHRAVPTNYLHVRVDEAAIDWWNGGANYDALITAAADEAGGQAFATDAFVDVPVGRIRAPSAAEMVALGGYRKPGPFFNRLVELGIPGNDVSLAIFRTYLPMPDALRDEGVQDTAFYNCVRCYRDALDGVDFDPVGFAAALDEKVAGPMRQAAALLARHAHVTRMTSSISPVEMTLDPRFGFSPSMDDEGVDPLRVATEVITCGDDQRVEHAQRALELPDRTTFPLPPDPGTQGYGAWLASLGLPAARVVERTSEDGDPVLISDQGDLIASLLPDAGDTDAPVDTDTVDCCKTVVDPGCDGCDHQSPSAVTGLGLLLLGLRRRRG